MFTLRNHIGNWERVQNSQTIYTGLSRLATPANQAVEGHGNS